MKFIYDLFKIEGKWSLSRVLLVIFFFALIIGLTPLTEISAAILGLLLAYVFGDKLQQNSFNLSGKKLESQEKMMIVD